VIPESKISILADLVIARLGSAPTASELPTAVDLTQVPVVFDRQKNILSEVAAKMGKAGGIVITFLYDGWEVADVDASRPRLNHRYVVDVWGRPILGPEDLPADAVVASAFNRFWHWRPEDSHVFGEAKPGSGGIEPDPKFLRYSFPLIIPSAL
jgi:hypothetical protein